MQPLIETMKHDMLTQFDVRLHVATATFNLSDDDLTEGESVLLTKTHCQDSFLKGRAALKKLSEMLSKSRDTSTLCFPHATISLSHNESAAIAVACDETDEYDGIGIDLESVKPLHALHANYFLNEHEKTTYQPYSPLHLTALWTIKEAAFKADGSSQHHDFKQYQINLDQEQVYKNNTVFVFKHYFHDDQCLSICLRKRRLRLND